MSDNRETAAAIFDRTAKLAGTLAGRSEGSAATALGVAAGISKAVATIVRAMGVKDAGVLIEGLARDKNDGKISNADLREDDKKVADAVDDMYDKKEDAEETTPAETPASKSKRSKRKS